MILAEPPPSQGDIYFRVFGIPVRIHPFFWVVAVLLSLRGGAPPAAVLLWIAALLVSIMIHELGHAFMQRRYGGHPRIVLHGMGGLAICGDCDRSSRSQILISLAGPGAGFLFAGCTLALISVVGHQAGVSWGEARTVTALQGFEQPSWIRLLGFTFYWDAFQSRHLTFLIKNLLFINIYWGAVNLLPIYPLDGGHVSRELCQLGRPREGIILSLQISMVAAIAMAVMGIFWNELYIVILFGYLAYSSYKTLEAYRASHW